MTQLPAFFDGIDSFGRMKCPGCGTPITVVTHIDKPGSPDGMTTVDVDLMPMAEHLVACADRVPSSPDTPKGAPNEGVERWLTKRRDEYGFNTPERVAIDDLLNELHESELEGWLPWQR